MSFPSQARDGLFGAFEHPADACSHESCYNADMPAPAVFEIPVTLHLSRNAGAALATRAARTGKPLAEYIAALVESAVESPRTLAQISGPVYQRFLDSGTTDEELSEELEAAKHAMRAERHARREP